MDDTKPMGGYCAGCLNLPNECVCHNLYKSALKNNPMKPNYKPMQIEIVFAPPFSRLYYDGLENVVDSNGNFVCSIDDIEGDTEIAESICHALNQTYGGGIEEAVEALGKINFENPSMVNIQHVESMVLEALTALKGGVE